MRHICMIFFRALLPFLAEILTKQKCLPMLSIGNPIFKKIQHPDPDPDHHQNRISSSSYRYLPITKIKKLLLQNCGRYLADTQTNESALRAATWQNTFGKFYIYRQICHQTGSGPLSRKPGLVVQKGR